jgi:hypothetical protein
MREDDGYVMAFVHDPERGAADLRRISVTGDAKSFRIIKRPRQTWWAGAAAAARLAVAPNPSEYTFSR